MSDLTIGLAVVGGLLLAAIFAHGVWTVHRNTPKSGTKRVVRSQDAALLAVQTLDTATESLRAEPLPQSSPIQTASQQGEAASAVAKLPPAASASQLAPSSQASATGAQAQAMASVPQSEKETAAPMPSENKTGTKQMGLLERISQALLPSDEEEELEHEKSGKSNAKSDAALAKAKDGSKWAKKAVQGAAASSTSLESFSSEETTALQAKSQTLATEAKPGQIDALIDSVAVLNVSQPIYGQAAIAAYPASWRCGTKPFVIEGQNVQTQDWERPQAQSRYATFQAAVQLSNRSGALNEIEFSEFVMKVNQFADKINAQVDFPEMLDEVARAKELDQFASDHDVQLAFVIQSEAGGWTWSYIQDHAAALGFIIGATPGKMVLLPLNEDQQQLKTPIISLEIDAQIAMTEAQTKGITSFKLVLDAPHVEQENQPFLTLCAMAKQLARSLNGKIVDADGVEISTPAMKVIADGLERLYTDLQARDFAAGSALARRLFSW